MSDASSSSGGDPAPPDPSASASDDFLRELARIDEAPARAADLVGTRLGRFRVAALLGRGGMGVVYRAVDEALRRDVALKVLPPGFADDEERRRRFFREARLAAAVSHPCIATIYEIGEDDGRIYIAMELLRGRTLAAVLAEGRLTVAEALRIARRILDGVGKAHEARLVHRDLKPDNVMLTDEGAVKVLDFGLAKPLESTSPASDLGQADTVTQVTTEGRVVGTRGYMSPEQARGDAVDQRSDVFSFGVVLYEMLAGRPPFQGRTGADVMTAVLRDEPVAVSKLNPDAPAALASIVARCLAKEAAGRYADCRSIAAALDRIGGAEAGWRRRRLPFLIVAAAAGAGAAALGLWQGRASVAPSTGATVASEPEVPAPPAAATSASAPVPAATPAEPAPPAASVPETTSRKAASRRSPPPPPPPAVIPKRRVLE